MTICDICIKAKLPLRIKHDNFFYCNVDSHLGALEGPYRKPTDEKDDVYISFNFKCLYKKEK